MSGGRRNVEGQEEEFINARQKGRNEEEERRALNESSF